MPTSTPDPVPARRSPSPTAGYVVMFGIGVMVGIVLIVVALRALESRRTWQDRYPGALMQLYQAQMAHLSDDLEASRCDARDTLPQLQTLRALSDDLEPAFADLRDHRGFVDHAVDMRRTLDASLASAPRDCNGLRRTIDRLGESCRACHQDLRS